MEKKETMIYMGPTIERIVTTGSSFYGGYPPKLQEKIDQYPYLSELIVPLGQLMEARKQIKDKDSKLNLLYRKAERGIK